MSDIEAARAELIGAGVDVGEPFHVEGPGKPPQSGLDPQRRSYFSYAPFSDPDGNGWLLQEVKTRFPGRGFSSMDVATLVPLLREAEEHHGKYEATAPKHHWSDWYAAYLVARERGRTPEDAAKDATSSYGERLGRVDRQCEQRLRRPESDGDLSMKTNKLVIAAVLAIAIGAPIAGFVWEIKGQSMTSTGVRVPFLHGFPTGQICRSGRAGFS